MRKREESSARDIIQMWKTKPDAIREFLNKREDYIQLCNEIAYILKRVLKKNKIEVASISSRAKSLDSFLEKISRKSYQNPFAEMTDFAGTRVVCLYQDDLVLVEDIIKTEFIVIEKVDKLSQKSVDQFGYGAIHYIVKLSKKSKGARYDDLIDHACEIQVRTVLQDAWAIIDHHLMYKNESAVPTALHRKLNSLAGLFETADDQFQRIRDERHKYVNEILDSKSSEESFLNNEVNLDSIASYLDWKFPNIPVSINEQHLSAIFSDIDPKTFGSLLEIDRLIEKYEKNVNKIFTELEDQFALVEGKIPSCISLGLSLYLNDPAKIDGWGPTVKEMVNTLVK